MSCPRCGCKVCYDYNDDDMGLGDDRLERCAACGEIFDIEDHADEDDDYPEDTPESPALAALRQRVGGQG